MKFTLNQKNLSLAFHHSLSVNTSASVEFRREEILNLFFSQGQLLSGMTNAETGGSISFRSFLYLFCLTDYFRPKIIAEVGTFIGRSTAAFVAGSEEGSKIHTCDFSNETPVALGAKVCQYPLTRSAEMFRRMGAMNLIADFVYLDGRLTVEGDGDLESLSRIVSKNTIYILDDFEGTEKGVHNATLLGKSICNYHALIYPPTGAHEFSDADVAVFLPISSIVFSRQ